MGAERQTEYQKIKKKEDRKKADGTGNFCLLTGRNGGGGGGGDVNKDEKWKRVLAYLCSQASARSPC